MGLFRAIDILAGKVSLPKTLPQASGGTDQKALEDELEKFPVLPPRLRRRSTTTED